VTATQIVLALSLSPAPVQMLSDWFSSLPSAPATLLTALKTPANRLTALPSPHGPVIGGGHRRREQGRCQNPQGQRRDQSSHAGSSSSHW